MQIKTKNVICHIANYKPVQQEVNSTVIIPPLVFPDYNVAPCGGHWLYQGNITEGELVRRKEKNIFFNRKAAALN
jgi:hypothetical protein